MCLRFKQKNDMAEVLLFLSEEFEYISGNPSSLYEPHKEHNMASNYKGLYGILYKISREVVKSENIQ